MVTISGLCSHTQKSSERSHLFAGCIIFIVIICAFLVHLLQTCILVHYNSRKNKIHDEKYPQTLWATVKKVSFQLFSELI